MKKIFFLVVLSLIVLNINAQKQKKVGKVKLSTEIDSVSYALGISIATNLKSQNINELNYLAIAKAMEDVFTNQKTLMSDTAANEYIQQYFEKKEAAKFGDVLEKEKKFLAENAKKEGVVTLKSGLQYKIIKEGAGNIPTQNDKVKTHYKGTLLDGTVFDSSYERGEPIVFGVTQVIKGWTEALMLMKEGSIWELYIPSELAYGSRETGPIKPFSTLIFTIELISIEK